MSMPVKAIVLVVALIVSLPAGAQFLGLGFESNIELTKQDLAIIHAPSMSRSTVGTSGRAPRGAILNPAITEP